jgi:uncharacterized protein YdhG (YjbR/CyaY superfamily)
VGVTAAEVDAYLDGVPEPQRSTLEVVRARLQAHLPQAEEVISYGVPAFAVDGTAVAGYSAAKNHCSYLPMSGSVLSGMADALGGYQWSKGALRFPVDEPLPEDLIAALVRARLAQLSH